MQRPTGWLPSFVSLCALAGCVDTDDTTSIEAPASCGDPTAYTPYGSDAHPIGDADAMPWQGATTPYPAGVEDFRQYANAATVECGSNKGARSHVDVTAGCLVATAGTHGQMVSTDGGAFRTLALGYAGGSTRPIKWTDQSVEYRFFYAASSGAGVNPGFKAFARYRTEDDLYVASWRLDGVVQIQKKQCGQYTALKILPSYGAPAPDVWHTLRFDAIDDKLELYLDGKRVISITDTTFSWGTAGIRTDAVSGALIDDWSVTGGRLADRGRGELADVVGNQR